MNKLQLPSCITAQRIGHWSMGLESGYDEYGEQAPVTWVCNCGYRLMLEQINHDTMQYTPLAESAKAEFLAAHTSCEAKCYQCNAASVRRQGDWCEDCSDKY